MDQPLTPAERERLDIIRLCINHTITNAEAAARLRLTVRQVRRLKHAVEQEGDGGIRHGNKGQPSNRATKEEVKKNAVAFMRKEKHHDFGPTFMSEQLLKCEGIGLSDETMRRFMTAEKLWKPRPRRGPQIHREWRERMPLYGELVQFDGSYHDWFEDGMEACLLAAIDDATGTVEAVFEDNEGVAAVFRFWWKYITTHGRPVAIYLDKFSTYKLNHKNALDDPEALTQFQRAMEELGIKVICAHSPQAKGRVERLFGTLQDRLVKEMRLSDIKDREAANVFLTKIYLPEHHERFSVEARSPGNAHCPLTEELRQKLPAIFSVQSARRVNNDFTVRFKNQWLQLKPTKGVAVYNGDTVLIEEQLDGSLHIRLRNIYLEYETLPERPKPQKKQIALVKKSTAHVPPPNHPWRTQIKTEIARRRNTKP